MPPKSAAPKNARAAFKPPRPINPSVVDQSSAPQQEPEKESRTTAKAGGRQSRSKGVPIVTSTISDSDEEEDANGIGSATPIVRDGMDALRFIGTTIPPKLLARLLHEHFEHDDTRITKEAMALFGRYVDLFAREAIARAIIERREASTRKDATGLSVHFLEIEDLEKLAPQLLLDFQ